MNTQTSPPDAPAPDLVVSNLPLPAVTRRLQGKIPSLPKNQRAAINKLLLDGATSRPGPQAHAPAQRGDERGGHSAGGRRHRHRLDPPSTQSPSGFHERLLRLHVG